ncbi:MAG: hypothetical protein ACRCTZ_16035 [Sarcina sp.]
MTTKNPNPNQTQKYTRTITNYLAEISLDYTNLYPNSFSHKIHTSIVPSLQKLGSKLPMELQGFNRVLISSISSLTDNVGNYIQVEKTIQNLYKSLELI